MRPVTSVPLSEKSESVTHQSLYTPSEAVMNCFSPKTWLSFTPMLRETKNGLSTRS
jgi:hypothetical protein